MNNIGSDELGIFRGILMNRFVRYWYQLMIEQDANFVHKRKLSLVYKLVITALMSALATMFQAAGNLIPGIGLLISPFATLPIFLLFVILFVREYSLMPLLFSYYLLFNQANYLFSLLLQVF